MRLIGLYRETEFSPGRHRSNDALLLEGVAAALRNGGFAVDVMTAEEAEPALSRAALVFSMCQGPRALNQLLQWEQRGVRLVNSPRASLNTYRDHLPALMMRAGIPFPKTRLVDTRRIADAAQVLADARGGLWLKRGDVHASVTSDVQWVDSMEALEAGLREFAARGVDHAAVQHHRAGDEIKFYGVAGGAFFHWFYPKESAPDTPRHNFDTAALLGLANAAAAAAGLDIFGGDVIVGADGELTIIDLNDWPSFAPCRDQASVAIAAHLMRRVDAAWNPSLVSSANQRAV
jgi:glutathione synthase/RimK-type ligase-like ATP-grasp enzyme